MWILWGIVSLVMAMGYGYAWKYSVSNHVSNPCMKALKYEVC